MIHDQLPPFDDSFAALTSGMQPFPWQRALFERFVSGDFPASCCLPTGLGKTAIAAVWLIALAHSPSRLPRRLVYVVNRRTVVDQTTDEVLQYRRNLEAAGLRSSLERLCSFVSDFPLAISTLRGAFADNREWCSDPARPAMIVGTVDMIGSRLLFNGYGLGFRARPLHAGFLGQDALLVHDEAHLEPAFQQLVLAVESEQKRCGDFRPLRVIELTATPRGNSEPFRLTPEESAPPAEIPDPPTLPVHHVWRRLAARKQLTLHAVENERDLAQAVFQLACDRFKDSGRRILVFLRTVDDVEHVAQRLRQAGQNVATLTGTMRGLERDAFAAGDPVFQRFKPDAQVASGTVYLVCTAAGEVGVNISADHLVCDLSTLESMIQRFGRVNRFGTVPDCQIHVVHPATFDECNDVEVRRGRTLAILAKLNGDASPAAIAQLPPTGNQEAFAPIPKILPPTDILFDAWALTTIQGPLPGRPPVEPYLHGVSQWQPPETTVAWREEVWRITGDLLERHKPGDLLADYPLKPHEVLRDNSNRVFKRLAALSNRLDDPVPAWIVSDGLTVGVTTLRQIAHGPNDALNDKTVLLPPRAGGLHGGMLSDSSESADDVADGGSLEPGGRRVRLWSNDPDFTVKSAGMRIIRCIDFPADLQADEDEMGPTWIWFERPANADSDGSGSATRPVALDVHTGDVTNAVRRIGAGLQLPHNLQQALILAAAFHDLGKRRRLWQRAIGNPSPSAVLAKSGGTMKPRELTQYRHEFGSLRDALRERQFLDLDADARELVLHLIAAHHGFGRPHFPHDRAFDPEASDTESQAIAGEVPLRFARLERRYGRWGLAYLESLLRAADYAASAAPSAFFGTEESGT